MQPRTQIIAHQRKEARNRECFPAVPQNVKVDGFGVEVVAEEGDGGVDGDHEEDADDVALFGGEGVVAGVAQD